eukprot:tig00021127_g18875.t1
MASFAAAAAISQPPRTVDGLLARPAGGERVRPAIRRQRVYQEAAPQAEQPRNDRRFDAQCSSDRRPAPGSTPSVLGRGLAAAAAIAVALSGAAAAPDALAAVAGARNRENNAQVILINALPVRSGAIDALARELGSMTTEGSGNVRSLAFKGRKGIAANVEEAAGRAAGIVAQKRGEMLAAVPEARRPDAEKTLDEMARLAASLKDAAERRDAGDIVEAQEALFLAADRLGSMMVPAPPFPVPEEYAARPRLEGRALAELVLKHREGGADGGALVKDTLLVELDGFSAPLTAGKFADLAARGAYDGTTVERQDETIVQTSVPRGESPGELPLEILVAGDKAGPVYGATLADAGRFRDSPALPFNAYGTVAMARDELEANVSAAQVFLVKADPVYSPAGLNLFDGNYAVLGYVVRGAAVLDDVREGDVIESVRIVQGADRLVNPTK